ncbi:unannotated protein [freshwater metagenome]|jgi:hypothetical protein|uniref:Unannotated protein n=1 Tax=freshwater metagenome TaxID=449393 RepID=A0A6J7HNL3_9ZZZZ|nr:hypothetical protein [Actinomycetota bacterium]
MSSAATALIWWIVPAMGLIGGLGYVLWVSKFQGKYQQGTQRSVSQFQRFQDSLRDSQARDAGTSSSQDSSTQSADKNNPENNRELGSPNSDSETLQ